MNTTLGRAAAEYLAAVREALEDLPDDEVAEIVDDVGVPPAFPVPRTAPVSPYSRLL